MSPKTIQGTPKLAESIKNRRQELGLTIEEAASRAGVGIKTWCRYEAGGSIRRDKAKGICKALNWRGMPDEKENVEDEFDLERYKHHDAWSDFLYEEFGEAVAISFAIGSDLILDDIEEDLDELSRMPRGTHVGELPVSTMKDFLPMQFLMRYDYEFLYQLRANAKQLRMAARSGQRFLAHSVMQEILIYLFDEASQFLVDSMQQEMEEHGARGLDWLDGWAFDLFDDMDVVTCLYSGGYVTPDHEYHFDHWAEDQFYIMQTISQHRKGVPHGRTVRTIQRRTRKGRRHYHRK